MKPTCKLIGSNGNVFVLIGLVSNTLKKSGSPELAKEFIDKVLKCKSYEEALCIISDYVEIE